MFAWLAAGGLIVLLVGSGFIYAERLRQHRRLALLAESRALADAHAAERAARAAARAHQALGALLKQRADGPVVVEVAAGSRAAEAGLQPGDTLLALIEWSPDALDVVEEITDPGQLTDLLERFGPYALLDLRVRRDGEDVRLRLH
jgi:S1-C subfamily serine protease